MYLLVCFDCVFSMIEVFGTNSNEEKKLFCERKKNNLTTNY